MTAKLGGIMTKRIMEWDGLTTWYRTMDRAPGTAERLPVIVVHGGPGLTHDYLLPVAGLAGSGHPCVFYDQVGNGRSDHRPEAPRDFWTVELFVRELELLVEHLGLAGGYHLLGHSWGGMLALELAVRRPPGLRSIVVADAFASSAAYTREVAGLVAALPEETGSVIERHEAAGTTEAPEYQEAVRVFYREHVFRAGAIPDDLMRTLGALGRNPAVYQAMAGPSEFTMTGILRDWDITDRLHRIEVPVLLVSGRYDEVTPAAVEGLHRGLPDARWVLFEQSSHMPHLEENAEFLARVSQFFTQEVTIS
ncbi:proline iminopeptidase-family hydrolase [Actinomadura sp. NEAU-AAG7]|uniref:proline iminopeptidase-family hydrolase n=1 Tax=Actinomadura sp. NEAU-AAG7 TaxID=2839640 RepID=UPI001BE46185|nr:proline iminopeptidase-family hydrolase [Actinomadura sp. NEAU-AAG7]MBT2208103.1 proline iminopeptidase-family hydrolase [Actinomadura sp. NEAU-AAG7]